MRRSDDGSALAADRFKHRFDTLDSALNSTRLSILVLLSTVSLGSAGVLAMAADTDAGDLPLSPRDKILVQFKSLSMDCTEGRYRDEKFSYRLFVPLQLEADQEYPLLLWFHGHGESGDDNLKNLTHLDAALIRYTRGKGAFRGFILVPQVPKGEDWFDPTSSKQDDMLTVAWTMFKQTTRSYPIDEDRILLAGVCSGGDACWEMGMRHPGHFAAISPIVTSGGDESRAGKLITTPIWAFHNLHDDHSPIDKTRQMVQAIHSAGGHAVLTEIPDVGHGAWDQAFGHYRLFDWLLARRRGEWTWKPYLQFIDWRRVAVQCSLPALIAMACWLELRRRRKMATRRFHPIPLPSELQAETRTLVAQQGE